MAPSPASPSTTVTLDVLITVLSKLHLSDVISAPKFFDAILQENAEPSKNGLPTSSAHRQAILQRALRSFFVIIQYIPLISEPIQRWRRVPTAKAHQFRRINRRFARLLGIPIAVQKAKNARRFWSLPDPAFQMERSLHVNVWKATRSNSRSATGRQHDATFCAFSRKLYNSVMLTVNSVLTLWRTRRRLRTRTRLQ